MPVDPDFLQPGGALASPVFQRALEKFDSAFEAYDAGTRVGPYRIVRTLGSGGMGIVYVAERADGEFEQTVALKLVRPDSDSPLAQDLLRRERQILASLEHPGIARLIDGGRNDDGTLWFALEFVDGIRIDDYCAEYAPTLEERLRLFAQVCDIVQFAHSRLLVHRDIKPANILVGVNAAIKLLDFGIAALLAHDSASATAERAMTPGYASPEQVRGDPITIASDIYQLGLLLQCILAPENAACEVPPSVAAIVAKATRDIPADRYATAAELKSDVESFLARRPVRAFGNGTLYRASCFARRHRWSLIASIATSLLFIATVVHFTLRVRAERDEARAQADRAQQVSQFLVEMFKVADPDVNRGDRLTATEILDRGAKRIDQSLAAQPALRGNLLEVIGRVYMNLGDYPRAEPLLEKSVALRKGDPASSALDRARTIGELAYVEQKQSKLADARTLLDEASALLNDQTGKEADLQHVILLDQRGLVQKHQGDLNAALASHEEALRLAKRTGEAAREAVVQNHLGLLLYTMDRYKEAQAAYEAALDIDREQFGESHEMTLSVEENLALTLSAQKKHAEAIDLMQRAIATETKVLGADNAEAAETLNMLGDIYSNAQRYEDAIASYRQALTVTEKTLGPRTEQAASILGNIGSAHASLHQYGPATEFLRKSIDIRSELEGADNYEVAYSQSELAFSIFKNGDAAGAETLGRQSLARLQAALPATHTYIRDAKAMLGQILAARKKSDEARGLLDEALQAYRAAGDGDGEDAQEVVRVLGELPNFTK